jgi:hypothetical protein
MLWYSALVIRWIGKEAGTIATPSSYPQLVQALQDLDGLGA